MAAINLLHPRAASAHSNLKNRCNNPNCKAYRWTGGVGIGYESNWETLAGFLKDMGDPPFGLSLCRKDKSLGYTKGNCFWGKQTGPRYKAPRKLLVISVVQLLETGKGDRKAIIADLKKSLG